MRLKIVHLCPSLDGGGAERQLSLLAAEQSRHGATVHVGTRRSGAYEGVLRASGVVVRLLGDRKYLSPRLLANVNSLLREVKPDIVQTWLPQMDVLGGACALLRGVPWILTERASARAYVKASAMTWLRRHLGRRASAVVANSRAGAEYWRTGRGTDAHIYTVPNAVDVTAIRSLAASGAEMPQDAGKLILMVGRLDHQKAVDVAIEAVARIPQSQRPRLLVLGDGPLRDALQRKVVELGVAERVILRSYQKNWWGLLSVADALVSVSRYEGQPNVVLEAMAGRCPLVVSDIPEHREFLAESSAIFVPQDDPSALAAALLDVLADPVAARLRAERAADRLGTLTVEAAATAYESLYKHLIAGIQKKCAES